MLEPPIAGMEAMEVAPGDFTNGYWLCRSSNPALDKNQGEESYTHAQENTK